MTWLKTDDRFPEHRKIRRLNDSAYRLHHTAMCACAKDETDGIVTEEDIADMEHGARLRKHVDTLVSAGLWDVVDGGWIIHDFLDYNPSHDQQNAKRAADRERQERHRKARTATPVTDVSQRDSRVTNAFVTPPVTAPRPVPSRPDPDPSPSGRSRGSRITEDWRPSQKVHDDLGVEYTDLDLPLQLASFRDYWLSKGEPRKDWDAAFRNWCRKAREYGRRPTPASQRKTTNGLTDVEWQQALDRALAADRASGAIA